MSRADLLAPGRYYLMFSAIWAIKMMQLGQRDLARVGPIAAAHPPGMGDDVVGWQRTPSLGAERLATHQGQVGGELVGQGTWGDIR